MTIAIARRWFTASGALVAELETGIAPATVFDQLCRLPHVLFLDSALVDPPEQDDDGMPSAPRLGRHSFVAADPIHSVTLPTDDRPAERVAEALAAVRSLCADLSCPTIPGLPPFQGGVAGLLSYECGLARLGLAAPAVRASMAPLLSLHVYDVVFAFDHDSGKGWAISQGVPARAAAARRARADERLASILAASTATGETTHAASHHAAPAPSPMATRFSYSLPNHPHVKATHSRESYLRMVEQGIDSVRAGDIFQVNLAQHMTVSASVDPVGLYRAARSINPAPFAGYLDAGDVAIASMSPERFLQTARGTVRMHPIKGTRRVTASPEADLYAAEDLGASEKDRAENVMIVDLVRNDLSRVCDPASVRVESLCRLERYRYVQHLVSIVAGRLRRGLHALDAVEAAIPGGSVTGAPKHRACEIISDLEGMARGPYCGSLGYIGFDGTADFNLLIRTLVVAPDAITFAVGGGITARSDPAAEYDETLHKAEGLLRVLDVALATRCGQLPAGGVR
ncbi:MAG: anthranilate synthase component I family protein [Planctomycetia bacterium]